MSIPDATNKAISTPPASKAEALKDEYHFAGDGIYFPQTVKAATKDEAEKIWKETRKAVEPPKK